MMLPFSSSASTRSCTWPIVYGEALTMYPSTTGRPFFSSVCQLILKIRSHDGSCGSRIFMSAAADATTARVSTSATTFDIASPPTSTFGGTSDARGVRCSTAEVHLMAQTAADVLIETLQDWGTEVVFGLPGDGINGIMEALRKRQDRIRFVQVRHEEAAAFMACAYAKYTGRLGCCLATSGPGGIHLLNGLYDAKLDQAPVLAITGMTYHDLIGTAYQQDVNTDYLFQDVALFNQRGMGPAHVVNLVDLACRAALAKRGVAHVTI